VILGISSPQNEDNYYSALTNLKDENDEYIFKNVNVKMACDACMRANKAIDCIHKQDVLPPWKDAAKQEILKKIMQTNPDLYLQESIGLVTTGKIYYISNSMIIDFLKNETWSDTFEVPEVYVAVDPSGGGSGSNFAICSGFFHDGKIVVSVNKQTNKQNKNKNLFVFLFFWIYIKRERERER
jgi:hypothetical protein